MVQNTGRPSFDINDISKRFLRLKLFLAKHQRFHTCAWSAAGVKLETYPLVLLCESSQRCSSLHFSQKESNCRFEPLVRYLIGY